MLSVQISELFLKENIYLIENKYSIEAPANNRRRIVLVKRTMHKIIPRLDCNRRQYTINNSNDNFLETVRDNTYHLGICTKKMKL